VASEILMAAVPTASETGVARRRRRAALFLRDPSPAGGVRRVGDRTSRRPLGRSSWGCILLYLRAIATEAPRTALVARVVRS